MGSLVSGLLKDPVRMRVGLDEMIEQERNGVRGDPDQEAASWLEKLSEVEQERRGYLRFAAKGHMTDEELDEALAELEETRMMAEEELATIGGRKEILEKLEQDRDALLESYAEMTPGALDALTPEERRQVYGMLRLRIEVAADGTIEAQGILSENVCVQHEDGRPASEEGFCENGLASLVPTGSKPPLSQRLIMLFLLWPHSIRRAPSSVSTERNLSSGVFVDWQRYGEEGRQVRPNGRCGRYFAMFFRQD